MSNTHVQLNQAKPPLGDKMDAEEVTVDTVDVKRQRFQVAGLDPAAVAKVMDEAPAADDYGLVTRIAGGVATVIARTTGFQLLKIDYTAMSAAVLALPERLDRRRLRVQNLSADDEIYLGYDDPSVIYLTGIYVTPLGADVAAQRQPKTGLYQEDEPCFTGDVYAFWGQGTNNGSMLIAEWWGAEGLDFDGGGGGGGDGGGGCCTASASVTTNVEPDIKTSTTLKAANADRKKLRIEASSYNEPLSPAFVYEGTPATDSNPTAELFPGDVYTTTYTGLVTVYTYSSGQRFHVTEQS